MSVDLLGILRKILSIAFWGLLAAGIFFNRKRCGNDNDYDDTDSSFTCWDGSDNGDCGDSGDSDDGGL